MLPKKLKLITYFTNEKKNGVAFKIGCSDSLSGYDTLYLIGTIALFNESLRLRS